MQAPVTRNKRIASLPQPASFSILALHWEHMANPFGSAEMAAGYATSRPPVHERVIEQVCGRLSRTGRFRLAVDVGCGAGVSTRALAGFANARVGLEPLEIMLEWADKTAPSARFIAARAEALPLRNHSADLITAAGSLNYIDLDLFFPEAARVLTGDGVLVIYDFSPGRSFRNASALDGWFSEFCDRYPPPPNEARHLDPVILRDSARGFRVLSEQEFEIPLLLTSAFYVNYMMTETNVAAAVRGGVPISGIRSWCTDTIGAIWGDAAREVLFRGYFVAMSCE